MSIHRVFWPSFLVFGVMASGLGAATVTWDQAVIEAKRSNADLLQANPTKIKAIGWTPTVGFTELVRAMVEQDLKNTH